VCVVAARSLDDASRPATPIKASMRLPPPSADLTRALRHADFANPASMGVLRDEVASYARALREATASPSVVFATVRGVVDDSLSTRVIPIRTSEDRNRLLALAADWSARPIP
jgi:hypothetical protein